jgi:phosphatidylserine/phosphatidylglycerophosphate/cardiolipin synthase-like enzyme
MKKSIYLFLTLTPFMLFAEPNGDRLFADSPFRDVCRQTVRNIDADTVRTSGNRVQILNDGYEALLLRIHLIDNASRSIKIQTFSGPMTNAAD